ncbi:MAG: hypothetical protein Q9222_000068 [Ikaeria aurantiellina]
MTQTAEASTSFANILLGANFHPALSPNGSSDNDAEMDNDAEGDTYGYPENEDENEDNEDGYDEQDHEDSQDNFGEASDQGPYKNAVVAGAPSNSGTTSSQDQRPPTSAPSSENNPTVQLTSPSTPHTPSAVDGSVVRPFQIRPEALTAPVYDIVPTIAAPHSTSINSIAATPDLRWVFSGGADGYIRKFNWIETVNGKSMLTVAQRHPFVDSVTKAGVLLSYWENEDSQAKVTASEDGPYLSSVYSLAVQRDGLWLLSGLENGGINLQAVRHDEGKQIACLRQHTSAISVLNLAQDERSALSGSWDKSVIDWDLNTGQVKRKFEGSGGRQISTLEIRPESNLPVPEIAEEIVTSSDTFSSNGANGQLANGNLPNGEDPEAKPEPADETGVADAPGSPTDSLFGGNDSLFGDNDDAEAAPPSAGNFVEDDDNEFSRAIAANGITEQDHVDAEGDIDMAEPAPSTDPLVNGDSNPDPPPASADEAPSSNVPDTVSSTVNGLPHAEELPPTISSGDNVPPSTETESTAGSTFLAASIDGSLRIWDKRRPAPVAKIPPRNVPPWCMNACWSPDGNFIYAGRRNGTVEEYSLHKGLRGVERSFKLPNGSGPVSAVRAMPNGRHIIWYAADFLDCNDKRLTCYSASYDILRLYDLEQQQTFKHSTVPFLIVPGHRTGVVSHLYIDPTCRYMISTAGNRGWEGASTEVLLGYEIGVGK